MVIPLGLTSRTFQSFLTWNLGLRTAHCIAQPLAIHSSEFKRRPGSCPKTSLIKAWTLGIRTAPPICSTAAISLTVTPAASIAASKGPLILAKRGAAISSKSERLIIKETSMSSMMQGQWRGAWGFAERIFLVFSQLARRRTRALLFDMTSILYFFWISTAKWVARVRSNSRPPRVGSYVEERTFIPALVKETMEHFKQDSPRSTKATFWSCESGRSFWYIPNP
mmetsp:Transcript_7989/g.12090  ORF Transcript_7989/g.12090 Transcript_7989/m.12090 type:complete len:224 (-) Transcript_7989:651-1322(-)